jgi:hypothetical protein
MSPNTNRSPVTMPAALAMSSGLPVMKPRAKLRVLDEAVAASCSAASVFVISAAGSATPRSAARSTKLRARSVSPAASASLISRTASGALKLWSSARSASRAGSSAAAMVRAACTPPGTLTAAPSARHAATPSASVMVRRVSTSVLSREAPHLGTD